MRTLLAACLCATALPALAEGEATIVPVGFTVPVQTGLTQTCPGDFRPATHEDRMFRCEISVPVAQADAAMLQARLKECDNPAYWNFGPHVRAMDKNGVTVVEWACYRM